ncbi:MAG TPA: tetratricopeptide repeat protein [Kofleriaceae bacterium]|nr:tetratricopeptide repeat protein [Kofleriaceae bacterium]
MRWLLVLMLCGGVVHAQPAPEAKPALTAAQKKEVAAYRAKAKAFVAKKQLDKAIAELEAAAAITPPDPDALFELAKLYEQVPDEENALAAYQEITSGKHLGDAQARIKAIIDARAKRQAEAAAKADAEAKAKAEADAKAAAESAARAAREAEEARQRSEREDRERRNAEMDSQEAALRASIEKRHDDIVIGAKRGEWDVERERGSVRRERGKRYLSIGLGCGAVAGIAAAIASIQYGRVEDGGFATASDVSFAISSARVATYAAWGFGVPAAVGIAAGVSLLVIGRDRGEMRVSAVAHDGMHGLALSGTLP